jgi:predicted PurR-regulated permease PerM
MRAFFLIGGLAIVAVLVWLFSPFAQLLIWAAILATAFYPAHQRVRRLVGGRQGLAAVLTTLLVILVALGPALALVFRLTREAIHLYDVAEPRVRASIAGGVEPLLDRLQALPLVGRIVDQADRLFDLRSIDLRAGVLDLVQKTSAGLASFTGGLVRNIVAFLFRGAILALAVGVMLRDGARWVEAGGEWLPIPAADREAITTDMRQATRAILYGMFLTATVQGALAGVGYAIAGLPSPILLASFTAVAALIPVGGTILVWLPAAIVLLAQGQVGWGVFLLIWGAGVVMTIDNFLRPIFIGGGTNLPLFWIFLAIFGGIGAFGFLGVILGPLILVFARAFLRLARRELRLGAASQA